MLKDNIIEEPVMNSGYKYKDMLKTLLSKCKQHDIKVVFCKDKRTRDYIGMNPMAARAMGFPLRNGKRVILVDNNMSYQDKYETLKHELDEWARMQKNGGDYWEAHTRALEREGDDRVVARMPC